MLGDRLASRDNNLNLIRAVAATAVLVSHAYPISLGEKAHEPLQSLTGYTLGTIAVFVFFAASGFLIASSFDRRRALSAFLRARFARLVPGLAVSVLLVALVLGPLVTSLAPLDYLTNRDTATFVLRNITIISPQYELPGVFATNPYPTVEGSIWTLVYEVACYLAVVAFGLAGLFAHRNTASVLLGLYLAATFAIVAAGLPLHVKVDNLFTLSQPFAVGMLMYLWRDRLPVSWLVLAGLVVLAAGLRPTPLFAPAFVAAVSYATIVFALRPGGAIRAYNRLGDYSYGIYIYAFPIQGLVVWLWGPLTPMQNMALAFPITLVLSVLSWHLVERPALRWGHTKSRAGQLANA